MFTVLIKTFLRTQTAIVYKDFAMARVATSLKGVCFWLYVWATNAFKLYKTSLYSISFKEMIDRNLKYILNTLM